MKQTIITITLLTTIQLVSAQERLPQEEALRYASTVSADAKQLGGTPISTDVDTNKPVALKDGEYGSMVLPQKNLSPETLARLDSKVVPIGQLWLLKLTPMRDGAAIASEKLRLATVSADGENVTVPQCALGVRRSDAEKLELVIFGKDKEPLLTAPLKTVDTKMLHPIDLSAERESDSGRLTVTILGKYQATFAVTELEL